MPEKSRHQRRKEAGLCVKCGGDREDSPTLACPDCREKRNRQARERNQKRREKGACPQCGEDHASETVYCPTCHEQRQKVDRRAREGDQCQFCDNTAEGTRCEECKKKRRERREKRVERRAEQGLCTSCGDNSSAENRRLCESCLARGRNKIQRLKRDVIEGYGGKCACCGEERYEFLQLDHINGDGAKERDEYGSSHDLYRDLRDQEFPPGYRVLCANCNFSKGLFGYCPHDKQSELQFT